MRNTTFTLQEFRQYRLQLQSLIDPLKEKISELAAQAHRPPTSLAVQPDKVPAHDADSEVRDTDSNVALAILGSEEYILAEVTQALARLDAGTFGICASCGRKITKTRLNAVPYARYCIRCARKAEAKE